MHVPLLLLVAPTLPLTLPAQTPAIEWARALGGSQQDMGWDVMPISDGGYLVVSSLVSTDGQVQNAYGGGDAWVVKLDNAGTLLWEHVLGGTGYDRLFAVTACAGGGFALVGDTDSEDGDITSNNHGLGDLWVVKLDDAGEVTWQRTLGGSLPEFGADIRQTSDEGFIVAGYTMSNDFDVSGLHGAGDAWLLKLDPDGSIEWQRTLGGTGDDYGLEVAISPNGGYFVAGSTDSNDGDVVGLHDNDDGWLVRTDLSGDIIWQRALGGSGWESLNAIEATADGGCVAAGYTNSDDGDVVGWHPGMGSEAPTYDGWLVKLSASSTLEWQRTLGGSDEDGFHALCLMPDGGYALAGWARSTDGNVTGLLGSNDVWVVRLNEFATLQWQQCLGGTLYEGSEAIALANDGGLIIGGRSGSNDVNVSGAHGNDDIWVVKLEGGTTGVGTTPLEGIQIFPVPAADQVTLCSSAELIGSLVELFGPTGRRVLALRMEATVMDIAVGDLSAGVYQLVVSTGPDRIVERLILE